MINLVVYGVLGLLWLAMIVLATEWDSRGSRRRRGRHCAGRWRSWGRSVRLAVADD